MLLAWAQDFGRDFLDFRLRLLQSALFILPTGICLCLQLDESLLLLPQFFELLLHLLYGREVRWDIWFLNVAESPESAAGLRAQVVEPPMSGLDITEAR